MATTVYFPSTGSAPISPSVHGGWDQTDSSFVRRVMNVSGSKSNTSMVNHEWNIAFSSQDECVRQYVSSLPLAAQTISGTVDVGIMASSSATGATFVAFRIWVATSAGGNRGTLCTQADSSNAISGAGDPDYKHEFFNNVSLSSVVCQDGDYLVFEWGVYATNSTSKTIGLKFGDDTSFSNVTSDSTSETTALANAVFSDDISFGTAPTDIDYDHLTLTGVIDVPIHDNAATITGGFGLSETYTVQTGSLPDGITLDSSTGLISGTPTVAGTYNFTIRVSNSLGSVDSDELTYTVVKLRSSGNISLKINL